MDGGQGKLVSPASRVTEKIMPVTRYQEGSIERANAPGGQPFGYFATVKMWMEIGSTAAVF